MRVFRETYIAISALITSLDDPDLINILKIVSLWVLSQLPNLMGVQVGLSDVLLLQQAGSPDIMDAKHRNRTSDTQHGKSKTAIVHDINHTFPRVISAFIPEDVLVSFLTILTFISLYQVSTSILKCKCCLSPDWLKKRAFSSVESFRKFFSAFRFCWYVLENKNIPKFTALYETHLTCSNAKN